MMEEKARGEAAKKDRNKKSRWRAVERLLLAVSSLGIPGLIAKSSHLSFRFTDILFIIFRLPMLKVMTLNWPFGSILMIKKSSCIQMNIKQEVRAMTSYSD